MDTQPSSRIIHGDCLVELKKLPDASVHVVLTDPPYGLSKHTPEAVLDCLRAWLDGRPYVPKGSGFMGRAWDAWVPGPEVWRECLRVLKPGGHVLAFAGTRSMDLMSMAIRLAGFELRDAIGYAHDGAGAPLLAWVYGSGFPKSLDVSKAIDDAAGGAREPDIGRATDAPRQWAGWGTALKPAWEPIIMARKPLTGTVAANVVQHGTGALNIDGCRIETSEHLGGGAYGAGGRSVSPSLSPTGMNRPGATAHGEFCQPAGRWPANVIHDGSDAVLSAFPDAPGQMANASTAADARKTQNVYGAMRRGRGAEPSADSANAGAVGFKMRPGMRRLDAGSAARFFYCAKASKSDRGAGNDHPTVKPTELMRYLVRLVTPPRRHRAGPVCGQRYDGQGRRARGFLVHRRGARGGIRRDLRKPHCGGRAGAGAAP